MRIADLSDSFVLSRSSLRQWRMKLMDTTIISIWYINCGKLSCLESSSNFAEISSHNRTTIRRYWSTQRTLSFRYSMSIDSSLKSGFVDNKLISRYSLNAHYILSVLADSSCSRGVVSDNCRRVWWNWRVPPLISHYCICPAVAASPAVAKSTTDYRRN